MVPRNFSKVKESVVAWNQVQQVLRAGDQGVLVPVVIPRDRRGYAPFFWFALLNLPRGPVPLSQPLFQIPLDMLLSNSMGIKRLFGTTRLTGQIQEKRKWVESFHKQPASASRSA